MFTQEYAFENVVCEMSTILSRPQSVKYLYSYDLRTWHDNVIVSTKKS